MDEKTIYKSLFKKLSALRATLSDEEQTLLDQLVVGQHEVFAHGMTAAATAAKNAAAVAADKEEAVAHGMTAAATAAKNAAAVAADKDEAVAHGMTAAATAAKNAAAVAADKDEAVAHGMNSNKWNGRMLRVAYDSNDETYVINISN